ncbi:MAG: hypothetical protein MUC41_16270, partial [Syntrophobacteraceae bacterium]|nr:hypothetical protein [Syntrophobacteraceae bacterium]
HLRFHWHWEFFLDRLFRPGLASYAEIIKPHRAFAHRKPQADTGMGGSGRNLDLLVEFEPGRKAFDNFMDLSLFLEEVLGHRVGPVTTESLSPYIGPQILQEVQYAAHAA